MNKQDRQVYVAHSSIINDYGASSHDIILNIPFTRDNKKLRDDLNYALYLAWKDWGGLLPVIDAKTGEELWLNLRHISHIEKYKPFHCEYCDKEIPYGVNISLYEMFDFCSKECRNNWKKENENESEGLDAEPCSVKPL